MDLDSGLGLLLVLPLMFVHLGFTHYHFGQRYRETARTLQAMLGDSELSATEKVLLLRFFYGCLHWWFLPVTLASSMILLPRLCFFAEERDDRLSRRTLQLMLRCLRLPLTRYPLTTLVAGALLLLWIVLVGTLVALCPRARKLCVDSLVRTLSGSLVLLSE